MNPTKTIATRTARLVVLAHEHCNLRCRFCMIGTEHGHMVRYSSDDIRRMLAHYSDRCGLVTFSGGEPTLRTDLPDLIRDAVKMGYQVSIVSNGRMYAYREYCETLIAAGAYHFTVSIHAPNGPLYKELTQADAFDQAVAGIKNMVALNQDISTATVVSNYNYMHMPAMAKLIAEIKPRVAIFRFYRPGPKVKENDQFEIPKENLKAVLDSIERAAIYVYKAGVKPSITLVPRCILPACSNFIKRYSGTVEGRDIYPRAGEEFYPKIDTGDDMDIVAGDRVKFWKEEGCKSCIHDKHCDGVMIGLPFVPKPMKHSPFEVI
jgi:MoaA/NifB/PqqE/SkfB family radical SAM enzyme